MTNHLLHMAMGVHRGMRRETNEDAVAYQYPSDYDLLLLRGALVVLADGVATSGGGAAASQMAVSYLTSTYYAQPITMSCKDCLLEAIKTVNRDIYETYRGSSTTVVAAVIHEERLIVAHVGDSRAYRIRKRNIEQLTRDHVVTKQRGDGQLKTSLTRALGSQPRVDVDIIELPLQEDDTILLVSDGITRYLKNHQLLAMMRPKPTTAVRDMIQAANKAGGKDNVGVIVVKVANELESQYQYFVHLSNMQPQIIVHLEDADATLADPTTNIPTNDYQPPQQYFEEEPGYEMAEKMNEGIAYRKYFSYLLLLVLLGTILLIAYVFLSNI